MTEIGDYDIIYGNKECKINRLAKHLKTKNMFIFHYVIKTRH